MSESDLEKPADSVEQERDATDDAETPEEEPAEVPIEVNEADVAEQHREVRLDEDDYR